MFKVHDSYNIDKVGIIIRGWKQWTGAGQQHIHHSPSPTTLRMSNCTVNEAAPHSKDWNQDPNPGDDIAKRFRQAYTTLSVTGNYFQKQQVI